MFRGWVVMMLAVLMIFSAGARLNLVFSQNIAPEESPAPAIQSYKIEEKSGKQTVDISSSASSTADRVVDKIIGATFKTLAKAFIATVDIEKLKRENIAKLEKKNPEKFKRQYVKIYRVIKDCPSLVEKYGLSGELAKEQIIEKIKSLKKDDMNQALDAVPDSLIAGQFRQYLEDKKEEISKSTAVEQIHNLWGKMIQNSGGK